VSLFQNAVKGSAETTGAVEGGNNHADKRSGHHSINLPPISFWAKAKMILKNYPDRCGTKTGSKNRLEETGLDVTTCDGAFKNLRSIKM
jgi:hypothetical protein